MSKEIDNQSGTPAQTPFGESAGQQTGVETFSPTGPNGAPFIGPSRTRLAQPPRTSTLGYETGQFAAPPRSDKQRPTGKQMASVEPYADQISPLKESVESSTVFGVETNPESGGQPGTAEIFKESRDHGLLFRHQAPTGPYPAQVQDLLWQVMNPLPVDHIAPVYKSYKKATNSTMVAVAEAFLEHKKDLVNEVVGATKVAGLECKKRLFNAKQRFLHSEDIHTAGVCALMVYFWARDVASAKREMINSIISDYLATPDHQVEDFLRGWTHGRIFNASPTLEAESLPGTRRLDPFQVGTAFTAHWADLLQACENGLSFEAGFHPSEALTEEIKKFLISPDNVKTNTLVASKDDAVHTVISRHIVAFSELRHQATCLGMEARLPDLCQRGANLLRAFGPSQAKLLKTVDDIVSDPVRYGVDVSQFPSWEAVVTVLELATQRRSAPTSAIKEALALAPKKETRPLVPKSVPERPSSDKRAGSRSDKGKEDPACLASEDNFLPAPPLATREEVARRAQAGLCTNCGEGHEVKSCPYKRADGQKWWANHDLSLTVMPAKQEGPCEERIKGVTVKDGETPPRQTHAFSPMVMAAATCTAEVGERNPTVLCAVSVDDASSKGDLQTSSAQQLAQCLPPTRPRRAPAEEKSHVRRVPLKAYLGHDDKGAPIVVAPDTCAEITMVSAQAVQPHWTKLEDQGVRIEGIGSRNLSSRVMVKIRHRFGASEDEFPAYIGSPPAGIDLLLGTDCLGWLGYRFDNLSGEILYGGSTGRKLKIQTYPVSEIRSRMATPPMTVLVTNAGCNLAYLAFRDLGYRVERKGWHSVEIDHDCREVTKQIVPAEDLTEILPNDTTHKQVMRFVSRQWYSMMVDSSPCQPFSRAATDPLGLSDTRAAPLKSAVALAKVVRKNNPDALFLVENVVPHPKLSRHHEWMEKHWGLRFVEVDAVGWGSASHRPRLIGTNIVDVATIQTPEMSTFGPTALLQGPYYCPTFRMACIMASPMTHHPPKAVHTQTGESRVLLLSEMEAMQGWPQNVTDGVHTPLNLSREVRQRMIGNALNEAHVRTVMRHIGSRAAPRLKYCPSTVDEKTPDQLELYLANMSMSERLQWFEDRFEGYEPPPLRLTLKPGQLPPARPPRGYPVPAGLVEPAFYAITKQIEKGYLQEVTFSHEYWITPGFVKDKHRKVDGTDIQAVRILGDFRGLNNALEPPPLHHLLQCPSMSTMPLSIPLGCKAYRYYDVDNAFHTCKLTADSSKLVVIQINDRLFMYLGGAQGISNMAIHWNVHINDGFCKALGRHHEEWWCLYVDDIGVFGFNETQTANRSAILESLLTAMGKPFSSKLKPGTTTPDMVFAGLHFSEHGVRIEDDAVDALRYALLDYPVKTLQDAQHVLGVVQYAHTAFSFDEESWLEYSRLISIIIEAITQLQAELREHTPAKASISKRRIEWGPRQVDACKSLAAHISNVPRAYCRPRDLISPSTCLVAHTDASNTSVCCSLFLVRKADARQVTDSDLKDRSVSQLVATKTKKLSGSELKWNTYEAELYGIVRVVTNFGNLITSATLRYPPSQPISKIGIWTDSNTAIGQWKSMSLPADTIDHLSAKARRFYSWADKCSGTIHWNLDLRHFPGENISLPHMLSHLGDMARERHAALDAASVSRTVAPAALHSFHSRPADSKNLTGRHSAKRGPLPPTGYKVAFIALNTSEVERVHAAYLEDDTEYLRVPLHDIFKVAANIDIKSVPTMIRDKVTPWIGKCFFAFAPPGSNIPLLFCPTTFQVLTAATSDGPLEDLTTTLVMVVPKNAEVRVTDSDRQPAVTAVGDPHPTHGDLMGHDLQKDLIYLAHNNSDHASLTRTVKTLREMCWFIGLWSKVRYHIDACPICLPQMEVQRAVSNSIVSAHRFYSVYVDHYIVKGDMARLTAVPAVLSLICSATKICMFIVVDDMTAMTTAKAIHNRWMGLFGVPVEFKSDKGPAFASEVMQAWRSLVGVKHWNFSATEDATHHALLEHRHETLHQVLTNADIKGDLASKDDLEYYVADAMAILNLHTATGDVASPFEKTTGQRPRVIIDMALATPPKQATEPINEAFLAKVRRSTADTIATSLEKRAETVRNNVATATAKQHFSNARTTDIAVGDEVSYHGKVHTVDKLIGYSPGSAPSKAVIVDRRGDEVTVNYSDITGLAEPTTELMIPQSHDLKVGDFILYDSARSGLIEFGVVDSISESTQEATIHMYEQAPKNLKAFCPQWIDAKGKAVKRRPESSGDMPPLLDTIPLSEVRLTCEIDDNFKIDQSVLDAAASKGYIQ